MFQIEFFSASNEGSDPEVLDRMRTDMTDLPQLITHAKSLFANAVAQRVHKPLPHGFRILDGQGKEVARWSLDESGSANAEPDQL
ncbi:MAG TPA: hypothetical protein VME69_12655 [Methylocella sp.]|nr:hypothetical protein [Methylocella sp.]